AESEPAEVAPAESEPAEVAPAESEPAEVAPAEVAPAEVAPAEVAPDEVTAPAADVPADGPAAEPAQPVAEPAGRVAEPASADAPMVDEAPDEPSAPQQSPLVQEPVVPVEELAAPDEPSPPEATPEAVPPDTGPVPAAPAAWPETGAAEERLPPEAADEALAWPPLQPAASPCGPVPAPVPPAGVDTETPPVPVDSRLTPVPQPTPASRPTGAGVPTPAPRPHPAPAAGAPEGQWHGGRPPGRRRRGRVLLAALVAVVVLAAAAVAAITFLGGRGNPTAAQEVPEAVLPALGEPSPALAALSAAAPVPDPTVLARVLAPLLGAPALGTGLSAQVVDVATGDVLFEQAADDPSTPASTAKLLTATAALTTLDPAGALSTTVVAGATPGEVVLVGGGDPTLSTTVPSRAYPGAATVADLAAQVRARLAGTTVTRVVVDTSLFTGPLTAPGWQPGDAPSTYAAPVTAAAVDGARVDPGGNQRSGSPGTDAGHALAAALGVPGAPVVLGVAPAGAKTLATVHSAPIERLVEQALTASDNLLAESLARHVAIARGLPATFAGAAQAVSAAVAGAGLNTTGLLLVDGSGLSKQDRVPARLLVDVVRAASDGTVPAAAGLLSGLPVAGYDGTLAERSADGKGVPGAVRAKTGTLLAVNDLAGTVLTADGRLLAFAVLADGAAGSVGTTETALDVVAAALAGCGCR
ncbi:MAG: dacB, partial [Modestobacter sp.]|nr:dacB [Modestobacter sp.]